MLSFTVLPSSVEANVMSSWEKWNGIEASSGWQWKKFGVVDLSSEIDILQVAHRESGVKLDKLLVTTDLDYVPHGKSKTTKGEKIYLEAESAKGQSRFAPWQVKSSSQASGGQYIEVPDEQEANYVFVPSQGHGKYKFNLSGQAVVWMRVYTPMASADSFWVKTSKDTMPRNSAKTKLDGSQYYLGLKPVSEEKYNSFPKAKVSEELKARALSRNKIDLSQHLPPPGNQGEQGSCTAWASAYAYKTYQEKFDHSWSVDTKKHQFSPAYVYNQINGGADRGAQMYEPFNLMEEQGVCPLSVMPYNENDYTTQPNQHQREVASNYLVKSWGTISAGNVVQMKSHIAGDDPVAIGIPVYPDINVSESNPVYDDTSGRLKGYHAITLVGYNDSKEAFKFINSWGRRWGFDGYGWISYDLIRNQRIKGYVMTDIKTDDGDDDDGDDDGDDEDDDDNDPDPKPTPTNLALNKPVKASSSIYDKRASNAVDGNQSTLWAARANSFYDSWIYVDLQKKRQISQMKIKWSARNYPAKYYIQRWNGWKWTTVKTINGSGNWDSFKLSNLTARYIRLRCTRSNYHYFTIYEWKILGN